MYCGLSVSQGMTLVIRSLIQSLSEEPRQTALITSGFPAGVITLAFQPHHRTEFYIERRSPTRSRLPLEIQQKFAPRDVVLVVVNN